MAPCILRSVEYYEAFSDLAGVYLEDSWVLEVAPTSVGLSLRLEAVLTPDHPLYEPPNPGDRHCYRLAWLSVRTDGPIGVRLSGRRPAIDASGEGDLGNLDVFAFNPAEDRWELEGDWGHASISSPDVTLQFE